jgi:hypothetical protein
MIDFVLGIAGWLGRFVCAVLVRLTILAIVLVALWYIVAHVVDLGAR